MESLRESWEVDDLDLSMNKLVLNDTLKSSASDPDLGLPSSSMTLSYFSDGERDVKISEDLVNQVDHFLREALQNHRERLSVLRIEQDIEKFVRDHTREQLEFQQLPTSYLRLAAHRVAQHYSLQSMVLLDNSLPDGSGSRIIVRKTSDCRLPAIRLADIPINIPLEETASVKFAIKQRPQKRSQNLNNLRTHSLKSNNSKSVEERKEEYERARARIFNSTGSSIGGSVDLEIEPKVENGFKHGSSVKTNIEETSVSGGFDMNNGRSLLDSSVSGSMSAINRTESEPVGRFRANNRVAIFRDREVDRTDPDYNRSYNRYSQRFDPGFGLNGGLYPMQPMYSPAMNYNTEFPQLGAPHRSQLSSEHQRQPLQYIPPWASAGIGYHHPETMMAHYNPNLVRPHVTSCIYMHSTQYPGMPFIHSHENLHPSYSQSCQQSETSFGLARPR